MTTARGGRPPSRALLYCTFNGAANCTNGIGRQTQTLLGTLTRRWEKLTAITGPFTPYLAIPEPGPATWAYDPHLLAATCRTVESRGGRILPLAYDTTAAFWTPPVWRQLSQQAAETARTLAGRYDHVAVIAVDTPFAGTGRAFLEGALLPPGAGTVEILLTLYGTAYVHSHPAPDPGRLVWEQRSLTVAGQPGVRVADIGEAFTRHLITEYAVDPAHLVPYRCSLDLTAPDLQPMPAADALQITATFGVPLDRPIVLAVGRTDPTKGFDQLITAVAPLRDIVHLVAVIVAFSDADPLTRTYRQQIADAGLRATYVDRFTRDLPRALASLPHTVAVVCPSRGESLANLPFEVGLWARHQGPIVVAPALGGFPETITDLDNGLLYNPAEPGGLTAALQHVIAMDDTARSAIRQRAYHRVVRERDVVTAYAETLTRAFTPTPDPTR
ncbi:glycosyltransferase [Solwaraspora sp. WMMB335]|uniref:glycosyltransferase n=1 Tax=Solwaraspora sp. WMMB335 TaxID=3404118 RepID=UPI003B94EA84